RRLLARALREPRPDRLERERIVPEQVFRAFEERERRRGRLVVALDRIRLAEPADALVADLDDHGLGLVGGAARDDEGLRHPQRHRPGLELHADTLEPRWRRAICEGSTRACRAWSGSSRRAESSTRSGTASSSRSRSSTCTTCA